MTSVVLDASAFIALLRREPGMDVVHKHLSKAIISAVNYSEVLKKTIERGGSPEPVDAYVRSVSLTVVPFDAEHAMSSAQLFLLTKPHGLSFADRACLALGVRSKMDVLTTDQKMAKVKLSVKVILIRGHH